MEDVPFDRPFGLCKHDSELLKSFNSTLKDLRGLIVSNIEFYQRGRSAIHARFYASFCILLERSQILEPLVVEIVPNLSKFDFSSDVPGNGYRSFISLLYRCCLYLLQLSRHIHTSKSSLFFQSARYCKDLECYVETLGQLVACLHYLKQLMSQCTDGELFLKDDSIVGDNLLLQLEMISTDCFYGRCLGFQFCESIQKALQAVMVVMATFSECYEEPSHVMQIASSLLNSGKYVVDQELRARQVVNVTRTGDIKFCKAFWSIPESPLLAQLLAFTYSHVEVSDIISLDPVNFELPSVCNDETVTITPPCAHTGPAPVKVRLISHALREGQDTRRRRFKPKTGSSKPATLPQSSSLLFHCHGGGFVSQSSQSHESYLRTWARELEVPILSVDYSLAPDLPFPRALEECFYAYAWALKNPSKLGWTGERVCFTGDSAGANLAMSTALRAVSFEIRVPDGIVLTYACLLVQYSPSPARFMSMIDPLLPVGILMRCLAAYAGIADEFSSALAKPIFCNPGIVEPWEMVDSSETVHVDDYIGEIKPDLDPHSDGAETTNIIDSITHTDISMAQESNGCLLKNGCENDSEATIVPTSESSDNIKTVDNKNITEKDLKTLVDHNDDTVTESKSTDENDDDEPIIVDSEMVPVDFESTVEFQNIKNPSSAFNSSKLFNYFKNEIPVKSIVSGFKSLISKPISKKVVSTDQSCVNVVTETVEQDVIICNENSDSYTDSCNSYTEELVQETDNCNKSDIDNGKGNTEEPVQETDNCNKSDTESCNGSTEEPLQETDNCNKSDTYYKSRGNTEMPVQETDNCNKTDIDNCRGYMDEPVQEADNCINSPDVALNITTDSNVQFDHNELGTVEVNVFKNSDEILHLIAGSVSHLRGNAPESVEEIVEPENINLTSDQRTDANIQKDTIQFHADTSDCLKNDIILDCDDRTLIQNTGDSKSDEIERDKFSDTEYKCSSDNETEEAEDMESYAMSFDKNNEHGKMPLPLADSSDVFDIKYSDRCHNEMATADNIVGQSFDNSKSISIESPNPYSAIPSSISDFVEPPGQNLYTFDPNVETSNFETQNLNGVTADPSELYAVCQELLDSRHCSTQDCEADNFLDSIQESNSCHTLEDKSSFYFYGDNRRLSIHSDGSCNSIEDSHSWITGEPVDFSDIDMNDIVTVIPDETQGHTQISITKNRDIDKDLNDPLFYISTSDRTNVNLGDTKMNSNLLSNNIVHEPERLYSVNTKVGENLVEKNIVSDIPKQMSVSENSDSGFQGDSNDIAVTLRKRKDDKSRTWSDPVDHIAGKSGNLDTVEEDNGSQRKQSRRTMSLDLTNNHISASHNMHSLSPQTSSIPRSFTMPSGVNEQLTKKNAIPRSSTVPELLSGCVTPKLFSVQRNIAQSPIQLFRRLPIVKNPYMSPYLAPDDMLLGLPEVHLVACHFDPLLDDSVMFARKLQSLNKPVDLHIVDSLPHGFLNFANTSPEAKQASKYCLNKIKDVLKITAKTT